MTTPPSRILRFLVLAAIVVFGATIPFTPSRAEDTPPASARGPVNALGIEIDLENLPSPHPRPSTVAGEPTSRLYVNVRIPWPLIEKVRGQYDWSVADEIVVSHAETGHAVVLNPHGANPLYQPGSPEAADAWTVFLRALASRYKDRTGDYLIGGGDAVLSPRDWAYSLKLSSVTIQSADPGSRIVMGPLDLRSDGLDQFLDAVYAEEIAPYVDAVAVSGEGDIAPVKARLQLRDPTAALWWVGRDVQGGPVSGGRLLRAYLEGLREEVAVCLFVVEFSETGQPRLLPLLERIRSEFKPSYTPLLESGRGLQVMTPMGQSVPVKTLRLFDVDAKKALIAYDAGEGATRGEQAVLVIDSVDLDRPVLKDIAAGEEAPLGAYQKDEAAVLTRLALPLADYPLVVEYRKFTSPLFAEGEKLEVTGVRLPSVEEILAKHQAFQAAQDALLSNLRADARVDFHFRIGTGSTFDVTLINAFYLEPKVGAEWEQKEFFVNGIKWRSDRIPEFPLPQPEKVVTLPLDISLDKRYAFRLAGEETVDSYDCWIVEFDPLDPSGSLYKGRVWIDKKSYARVQIASVQTGLAAPIISNDEKDSYRPLAGPAGVQYWLLSRIDGQQVFSTAGRNLVVVREVTLSNHVINDQGFADLRQKAYASNHQILRDTPKGPRYLERTEDGNRVVKDELDPDNMFLAGGVYYNRAVDFPIPLAGFNYYNRNLAGKGIQANVFFAGLLLFANVSDPSLFGTHLDASVDLFAQGFSTTDRPVRDGEEVEKDSVDLTSQSLYVGVGWPFLDYWKVKLNAGLEFQGFSRDQETRREFVLPKDTYVTTVGLEGEFNRKAWAVTGSISFGSRGDWRLWGDPNNLGTPRQEFFEGSKDYVLYEGVVSKDFFLPLNQKVHAAVTVSGGSDLDRFSKYHFSFFGNRVRGFSGAGIRYTQGARAQVQYAFNLGQLVRFDATLDHARVKDGQFPSSEYQNLTGVGLSGQTILGPNLIVSLDWGIAVASDVDQYKGDQEVLLTILRLFK